MASHRYIPDIISFCPIPTMWNIYLDQRWFRQKFVRHSAALKPMLLHQNEWIFIKFYWIIFSSSVRNKAVYDLVMDSIT